MDLTGKRIVAIIAHPDDETIGCGGLLCKASALNAACKVVLPLKRKDARGAAHWDKILAQFGDACRLLGAQPIYTDETVDDITAETEVHRLFHIILEHVEWADIILTHWHGDSHQAHRAVSRAVELGTRPFRTQKTVMCFEIATSTDQAFTYTFSPNCFVILTEDEVKKKTTAMSFYESEAAAGRTPQDLESQLRSRGRQINRFFAEAFVITRHFIA